MRPLHVVAALALLATPLAAQERANVVIAHATPEQAQAALTTELAAQKFELGEHNAKHLVYAADNGKTVLADGTTLKLRYELEFRMKPSHDSLAIWLFKESLVGASSDGQERRQERDPKNNVGTFQGVLEAVKAKLEKVAIQTSH